MSEPRTIVFDLDGTLVDTASDLVATLNAVLKSDGQPIVTVDEAVPMVGYGARVMLEKALAANGILADRHRLDTLTERFLDHYSRHIADESRPFPGAEAMLDRFRNAGWLLAVCTNKLEPHARLLLAELGLADRFAVIAGQDTFGVRKPDPRHLTETIKAAGGIRASALMVGDSEIDVATARAVGVPVVAVEFGYSTIPAAELGADWVIGHFDMLYGVVEALQSAQPFQGA